MYVLLYECGYIRDPVRLRLRHLYQVELCSFIVRYPTVGASMYCGHISSFSMKTYVVGTHEKRLTEALLMNIHNICFHGEIRRIFI